MILFFFFKQKTAYEMRISDWSSDVCSSDLFASPVAGSSAGTNSTGSVRLIAPDAQLPWDPATEAQLRAILTELVEPGAPPAITGIANGFHVPGTLPGQGATQLFLNLETGAAVSSHDRKSQSLHSSHKCAHRIP